MAKKAIFSCFSVRFALTLILLWRLLDRRHLRKTQINLVFHLVCTIFAADFSVLCKKVWESSISIKWN